MNRFLRPIFLSLICFSASMVQGASLKRLVRLAPYKDIAVLQKKYLPKTERFELFVGGSNLMNDAFFWTYGVSSKLSYHFTEQYAVEASLGVFEGSDRQVVEDLKTVGVSTTGFVTSRQYYGLDFKWSPVYGKMSYLHRKIIPYEIYFTGGLGMTKTNQDYQEPSLHLGAGQMFAISKSLAVKWDFSYTFFKGRYLDKQSEEQSQNVNNVFISVGLSWFFPEATYR